MCISSTGEAKAGGLKFKARLAYTVRPSHSNEINKMCLMKILPFKSRLTEVGMVVQACVIQALRRLRQEDARSK
jgi:hypothetical protein